MTKSKLFLAAGVVSLVSIIATMHIVHAETRITDGYLNSGAVWTAAGSPYIVESPVTVPKDMSLIIEAGTSIIGSADVDGYSLIYVNGSLVTRGQENNRISISGSGVISIGNGSASFTNTDIRMRGGLDIFGGLTVISSSTIASSTKYGIQTSRGKVEISNSRISDNGYGVYVKDPGPIYYLVKSDEAVNGVGGIGNALDGTEATTSDVIINDSAIVDNSVASIYNERSEPVIARNDWWGTKDGPTAVSTSSQAQGVMSNIGNKVVGNVLYSPWLERDPADREKVACCSSVLFLPGLEASRLYNVQRLLVIGSTTAKSWEPIKFTDVQSLYMNSDGTTMDHSVYSSDIIDRALNIKGIYSKLTKYLDGLSKDGTINSWRPFAYDWRKPVDQVVNGREARATTTESLVDVVKDLAAQSQTGKVTIVAHSNGGLVAKYLTKVLADQGQADLIDKVISVAVPYLGTPQAIMSLLHGTDQSIGFGTIVKEYVMRGLGVNMASAYSLLPSSEYIGKVFGPIIAFASTTIIGMNDGSYPRTIADHSGQTSFILDSLNGRLAASTTGTKARNTALAIKGNPLLMNAANILHGIIDPFSWPANIARWAIVGWNKDTTSGVSYSQNNCLASLVGLSCPVKPVHEKIITSLGDGTVVATSAAYNGGVVAAVDLKVASDEAKMAIEHSNILESGTTLELLDVMIKGNASSSLSAIPGVTIGQPTGIVEPVRLVISTHSPVELHVYDALGNHTGHAPLPPELAGSDIYEGYEANIPGSQYSETDGGDSYVYLPDDGKKYTVSIQGAGVGEFTLDVERKKGIETLDSIEFPLVPVSPLTVASTTVQSGDGGNGSAGLAGTTLASTTPSLAVDIDGDGTTDMKVAPNGRFDLSAYLKYYKKTIQTIAGDRPKGRSLVNRIDKLEGLIRSGKMKKARDLTSKLDKRMEHMKGNKITDANRQQVLDMFDVFVQQFE